MLVQIEGKTVDARPISVAGLQLVVALGGVDSRVVSVSQAEDSAEFWRAHKRLSGPLELVDEDGDPVPLEGYLG